VVEADRQQPLSGHVLDTTVSTASAQMLVQVGDRLGQPSMMGRQYGSSGGRVAQAVEDRDALGGPQHHIKAWHSITAMRAAQQLASGRVAAFEHGLEFGHGCFAMQPQGDGAGAVPAACTLAVAGQVLLVVGGQLASVVLLPPHRQLRDVGHHPAAASSPASAPATHPWCIALLRRFRVESRARRGRPSVMTRHGRAASAGWKSGAVRGMNGASRRRLGVGSMGRGAVSVVLQRLPSELGCLRR
jgi:hypothetical protein